MKKIILLLVAASLLTSVSVSAMSKNMILRDVTTTTVNSDDGESGDEAVEETETPTPEEENKPVETAMPEDYSGVDNPEDIDNELTGGGGTVTGPGAAGGLGFSGSKFPDCRGHWAEKLIIQCTEKKYLDGYDDGNFYPDNPITASEFAKIFSAWRGNFFLISNGYWATPYIRNLIDDGIFELGEYSDYNVKMTREQVAKAVINSLKAEYFPSNLTRFAELIPDINDVDENYSDYIVKAYISGIMTGYDDGSIKPRNNVTRAELLSIIDRTMNPQLRKIPDAVKNATAESGEENTYYSAAVAVRKSVNAQSMNFRLLGENSQYMTENDDASGLRMSEEFQGAQGFAFVMRYNLSDILKREDELENISLVINHESGGTMDIGLYWYENKISSTDWNNTSYTQVINGAMVAGDNKAGYNAIVDNISSILPTWGDTKNAVSNDKKTQPFTQAKIENGKYVFELSLDELKKHMNSDNTIELFATTVNYDRYGMNEDNKPKCFVAGTLAPQLKSKYKTEDALNTGVVTVTADKALLSGGMLNLFGTGIDAYIENFRANQIIDYSFDAPDSGKYKMTMYYSANLNSGGGTVHFNLNGNEFDHTFAQTGSWSTYVYEDVGETELKGGENKLILTDKDIPNTYLINIKTITFEKID